MDTSPPSRAAWIEMGQYRNASLYASASPPSRAAWIEIERTCGNISGCSVAAFTGGVD